MYGFFFVRKFPESRIFGKKVWNFPGKKKTFFLGLASIYFLGFSLIVLIFHFLITICIISTLYLQNLIHIYRYNKKLKCCIYIYTIIYFNVSLGSKYGFYDYALRYINIKVHYYIIVTVVFEDLFYFKIIQSNIIVLYVFGIHLK